MAKIHKLKKDGVTIYPATIPAGVIDPVNGKTLNQLLEEKEDNLTPINDLDPTSRAKGLNVRVMNEAGKKKRLPLDFLDIYSASYGIQWNATVANSACTRVGRSDLHKTLPIQSKYRRCLLADDGTVNAYLHPDNSNLLENGEPADLSGASGQVSVEMPEHWERNDYSDYPILRHLQSEYELAGFFHVPKRYVSAYEATVERSTSKLSSVKNIDPDYRGGNNSATNDGNSASLLGMPATAISLTNGRIYASNRGAGWSQLHYDIYKTIVWSYFVEYANFNVQLPFESTNTVEGYKKGGLGDGVTTLNGTKWTEFNGVYPFIPCGYTNSLGNKSGVKAFVMPDEYDIEPFVVEVPSYRGIENIFGHIWKWCDGVKMNIQADDAGGESQIFTCNDITKFKDNSTEGYQFKGLAPRASTYVKEIQFGDDGDIIIKEGGASSATYFSDYFYTSTPASGVSERGLLFGGYANNGAAAGLSCAYSDSAPSVARAHFGFRLCFTPTKS